MSEKERQKRGLDRQERLRPSELVDMYMEYTELGLYLYYSTGMFMKLCSVSLQQEYRLAFSRWHRATRSRVVVLTRKQKRDTSTLKF